MSPALGGVRCALIGASLKLNKTLTVTLVFVFLLELLLAIGSFTSAMFVTRVGAICGIVSALLALYLATAGLWNRSFGRTVLPVGEFQPRLP